LVALYPYRFWSTAGAAIIEIIATLLTVKLRAEVIQPVLALNTAHLLASDCFGFRVHARERQLLTLMTERYGTTIKLPVVNTRSRLFVIGQVQISVRPGWATGRLISLRIGAIRNKSLLSLGCPRSSRFQFS